MLNPEDRALQTQANRGSEFSFIPHEQPLTSPHVAWSAEQTRYRALTAESVIAYLAGLEWIGARLGPDARHWQAHERGDGNLNLVFFVEGPAGAVVVKQALPYVRMVGESWPLSLARNFFEHSALREQARWAAEFVPALLHTDDVMALMVMELLSPHVVLRKGLIAARRFPNVGRDLGRFLARTLVNTSDLRLASAEKKTLMGVFLANTAMCKISEDVVFDEPYFAAPFNRHTAPQLDGLAGALARDTELKVAVQAMKSRFMNQPECLVHGDLHTGSVMVTESDTRVIDAEFAFFGPMGFDLGVLIANFLMAYLAQPGHAASAGGRDAYRGYLLEQIAAIWTSFSEEFAQLWRMRATPGRGDLCNPRLAVDAPAFEDVARAARLEAVWQDALGFAGCEMIRRIVGLAHVADFEAIAAPETRARCERHAIELARELLLRRTRFGTLARLIDAASMIA
jgi:5-methylthioribose kinase